ncbi:MAG: hypothetical protein GX751_07595 [Desulfuromonadaceae bacterium]|nr:hypothetical protein [Desulfuromonadaceae bacterium]
MTEAVFDGFTRIFDPLSQWWEKPRTQRFIAAILVVLFLAALGFIELGRQDLLPASLSGRVSTSHYQAINIAFTFVMVLEVVGLIFTLPCSVSRALGKQFEILALIFIRNSFKEISVLPEPIAFTDQVDVLWRILADGGGALAIFALLGFYGRLLRKSEDTLQPGRVRDRFVAAKKGVSLLLLAIFIAMGLYGAWSLAAGDGNFHFFPNFYTVLIFSDILLVLIAQCYLPEFRGVFRNSAYALATLLIRLSLAAPPFYNVLIGVASALFAVALTWAYNNYSAWNRPLAEK